MAEGSKFYLLKMIDGIEACLLGPYETAKYRDEHAAKLREISIANDDGDIYVKLTTTADGKLEAESYCGVDFMTDEEIKANEES